MSGFVFVAARDGCLFDVCQHGGTCTNTNGIYLCLCPSGYTGNNCESGKITHDDDIAQRHYKIIPATKQGLKGKQFAYFDQDASKVNFSFLCSNGDSCVTEFPQIRACVIRNFSVR